MDEFKTKISLQKKTPHISLVEFKDQEFYILDSPPLKKESAWAKTLGERNVKKLVCTLESAEVDYRFDAFDETLGAFIG